jgi:hypothetical protein
MALVDHDLFKVIKPSELMKNEFTKPERSPRYHALVERLNAYSSWAQTQILRGASPAERAARFAHVIRVARHCVKLRDFSAAATLVGALRGPSLSRLKAAQAVLLSSHSRLCAKLSKLEVFPSSSSSPSLICAFASRLFFQFIPLFFFFFVNSSFSNLRTMQELFSPVRNHRNYREALRARENEPAVPYLALYVKFLFGLEENLPSYLEPESDTSDQTPTNAVSIPVPPPVDSPAAPAAAESPSAAESLTLSSSLVIAATASPSPSTKAAASPVPSVGVVPAEAGSEAGPSKHQGAATRGPRLLNLQKVRAPLLFAASRPTLGSPSCAAACLFRISCG